MSKPTADYRIGQGSDLRHTNCGGQIAIDAELYVFVGLGFPRPSEVRGCRTEPGPHGTTIARKFGGYHGYCMKCHKEGNFYGPRYTCPGGWRQGRPPHATRSSRRRKTK